MNNDDSKLASLCKGGCGFYGSEIFNNMCSKCYKDSQMARNSENDKCPAADSKDASIITSSSSSTSNPSLTHPICTSTTNTTTRTSTIPADVTAVPSRPSRKHRRSASPIPEKKSLAVTTAGTSSSSKDTAAVAIASSMNQSTMAATAAATLTAAHSNGTSVAAATSAGNEYPRPPQVNKGKCYQCRAKVPLVKQTTNKCRCQYIFCDSHRYPDRHDCFIDFGKLDRAELAKNNPKLHERPAGGRSFRRIDSI